MARDCPEAPDNFVICKQAAVNGVRIVECVLLLAIHARQRPPQLANEQSMPETEEFFGKARVAAQGEKRGRMSAIRHRQLPISLRP